MIAPRPRRPSALVTVHARCRRCRRSWVEGVWRTGERPSSRLFCPTCHARPPHDLASERPAGELPLFPVDEDPA